jgi:hypothetical protein
MRRDWRYLPLGCNSVTSDGNNNTGVGSLALPALAGFSVYGNTAVGSGALLDDSTGSANSALGASALQNDSTGAFNVAVGANALWGNTTGDDNTAIGINALQENNGGQNTAVGGSALIDNGIASYNTASGAQALYNNDSDRNGKANYNTGVGYDALYSNVDGSNNTASGSQALFNNSTGNGNIAVGYRAGYYVKDGYNIDIGNTGAGTDAKTIKIGTEGTQLNTYIAGIYNVTSLTGGLAVFVDSTGHLCTASSSERFKADIASMGSSTEKLRQLRPVTFHYKADTQGTLRYGLIAEEVAKVYPELVVRDNKGRVDGVRYDELAPMLLNELQKVHATAAAQAAEIRDLKQQVAKVNDLEHELTEMRSALGTLQSKGQLVVQR